MLAPLAQRPSHLRLAAEAAAQAAAGAGAAASASESSPATMQEPPPAQGQRRSCSTVAPSAAVEKERPLSAGDEALFDALLRALVRCAADAAQRSALALFSSSSRRRRWLVSSLSRARSARPLSLRRCWPWPGGRLNETEGCWDVSSADGVERERSGLNSLRQREASEGPKDLQTWLQLRPVEGESSHRGSACCAGEVAASRTEGAADAGALGAGGADPGAVGADGADDAAATSGRGSLAQPKSNCLATRGAGGAVAAAAAAAGGAKAMASRASSALAPPVPARGGATRTAAGGAEAGFEGARSPAFDAEGHTAAGALSRQRAPALRAPVSARSASWRAHTRSQGSAEAGPD